MLSAPLSFSRSLVDCGSIAEQFGRPVDSVYVTLSRARAQLRDCILKQRALETLR